MGERGRENEGKRGESGRYHREMGWKLDGVVEMRNVGEIGSWPFGVQAACKAVFDNI